MHFPPSLAFFAQTFSENSNQSLPPFFYRLLTLGIAFIAAPNNVFLNGGSNSTLAAGVPFTFNDSGGPLDSPEYEEVIDLERGSGGESTQESRIQLPELTESYLGPLPDTLPGNSGLRHQGTRQGFTRFLFLAVTNQSTGSYQITVCHYEWLQYVISFLALWSVALITEITIVVVSSRGTIFSDGPRKMAEFLLYVKLSRSFVFLTRHPFVLTSFLLLLSQFCG